MNTTSIFEIMDRQGRSMTLIDLKCRTAFKSTKRVAIEKLDLKSETHIVKGSKVISLFSLFR